MKIIEEYNPDGVDITEIKPGDMFVFNGSYYIRCVDNEKEPLLLENTNRTSSIGANLANGELIWISSGTKVPPIYGRIRINGRAD